MRPKATIDDDTGPVGFLVIERQGKAGRRLRAISRRFTVRSAADQFMELSTLRPRCLRGSSLRPRGQAMRKQISRRRYLRIDDQVYNSEAFRTLPPSAAKLWVDMRTQFSGSNNGAISAAMSLLVHRGWVSNDTLHRALGELLDRGLLACTRKGKPGPFQVASLFRFTDLVCAKNEAKFVDGRDASHEYRTWTAASDKKSVHRKSEQTCTGNRSSAAPDFGGIPSTSAPEIGARKNDEIAAKSPERLPKTTIRAIDAQPTENRGPYEAQGVRGATVWSQTLL